MGTRGAYGFRINGKDKITYNHFDSYPSGLGSEILTFIADTSLNELANIAMKIVLVREDAKPSKNQIEECKAFTDVSVSKQSTEDWYCLLRGCQGNLNAYKTDLRYMIDSHSFLFDSLFCEYAYIINVDSNMLEVYKGFNKDPNAQGRYAVGKVQKDYYGVALIKEIPLGAITKDTVQTHVDEIQVIVDILNS